MKSLWEDFIKKYLQETSKKELKIEKLIKRKCDETYVIWKDYDDSFKSWINMKYIV